MLCFHLLAFVQIVLESFPVSSSGHLLLVEKFLHVCATSSWVSQNGQRLVGVTAFLHNECIEHILHGPTVVVLALFFFPRWSFFLLHLTKLWRMVLKLFFLIGVADSMTAIFYVLFRITGRSFLPAWIGFAFSAAALFSLRFVNDDRYESFTWRKAAVIGFVQGIAFLPGVSRLAVTYVAARWLRISPKRSLEISFLIFAPLIVAAFFKSFIFGSPHDLLLFLDVRLMGVFVAAIVISLIGLWCVQWLVYRKKIWIFSLYLCVPMFLWLLL